MNEQDDLGRRIATLLDAGADDVGPAERERLMAARQMALARLRPDPARARVPAWLGVFAGVGAGSSGRRTPGAHYLIPIAALVLGLAAVTYMHWSPSNDIADIDAGLLTDDLPINAYLDQGFDSWLKRSSR
jgi:hypothetical protein